MKRMRLLALALVLVGACTSSEPPSKPGTATGTPTATATRTATATGTASARHFGAAAASDSAPLTVAAVMADPAPHLGKTVRCEGVVSRVCERAGCWLELSADGKAAGLRVPMAGHAFFIPQDAVGQRAVVEGELSALPLSDAQREHLESEGLQAIGPLALAAKSVDLSTP